jgi:hypothetical protein
MQRDPAVCDGGFNRCAIFLIAAAGRSKLPIDDLDRHPSSVIGLKPFAISSSFVVAASGLLSHE